MEKNSLLSFPMQLAQVYYSYLFCKTPLKADTTNQIMLKAQDRNSRLPPISLFDQNVGHTVATFPSVDGNPSS